MHRADVCEAAACVTDGKRLVFFALEEEQSGIILSGIGGFLRVRIDVVEDGVTLYRAVLHVVCDLYGLIGGDIIIPS